MIIQNRGCFNDDKVVRKYNRVWVLALLLLPTLVIANTAE